MLNSNTDGGWREDFSSLKERSSDPSDPEFEGFIDAIHEDGRVFKGIYKTPLGRLGAIEGGAIPAKGRFVKWRESELEKE